MLKLGMLWYDDSKESLVDKVMKARDYYVKKYNQQPNLCLIRNDGIFQEASIEGVTIRPYKYILSHHFWIGIQENE